MKKIINSSLAFVTLFSVTSCDLDMDPKTAIVNVGSGSTRVGGHCKDMAQFQFIGEETQFHFWGYTCPTVHAQKTAVKQGGIFYDHRRGQPKI